MAVLSTDLKFYKSANNFGGAITATVATGGNIFAAFSGPETTAGRTEYVCVYAKNDSAQTAFGIGVYVNSETSHDSVNATIALGNSAINGVETATASEITAPSPALTFVEANGSANELVIGDLAAGAHKAVWIRLVVPAGTTAFSGYTIQMNIAGDTGA